MIHQVTVIAEAKSNSRSFFAVSSKEALPGISGTSAYTSAREQAQRIVSEVVAMPSCNVEYAREEIGDVQIVVKVDDTDLWRQVQPRIVGSMVEHMGWQDDYEFIEHDASDIV